MIYRLLDPYYRYVYNFLRKVESSFREYANARLLLDEYITSEHAVSKYLAAVLHYEVCIAQAYRAYMLARNISGLKKLFDKGDGSALDRLNKIYNLSKHFEETIAQGQLPENNIIPMWITNSGLYSDVVGVNFDELVELLQDLGDLANMLSNPNELFQK